MYSGNAGNVTIEGDSYIPPSQRPDGTWRKARRVKEGYVPQEEVPLYESKGKQIAIERERREALTLSIAANQVPAHRPIPGLYILDEKLKSCTKKKKKPKDVAVEAVTKQIATVSIKEEVAVDPAKKLKNLKKRLREVEALEEKLKNNLIAHPEPDQLAKIQRKTDLILQIDQLEKTLQ